MDFPNGYHPIDCPSCGTKVAELGRKTEDNLLVEGEAYGLSIAACGATWRVFPDGRVEADDPCPNPLTSDHMRALHEASNLLRTHDEKDLEAHFHALTDDGPVVHRIKGREVQIEKPKKKKTKIADVHAVHAAIHDHFKSRRERRERLKGLHK